MTMATAKTRFTPDDLLRLPDAVAYELVEGTLVERHMSLESSWVAAQILTALTIFLRQAKAGWVFGPDASYKCFIDAPEKVRKPDVSFIRAERLPEGAFEEGHCPIAPDLAVEVISPGDLAFEIREKISEYLRAGVRLMWVVYPSIKMVEVYRPTEGPHATLHEHDTISGEDVLPGFSYPVRDFFAR